MSDNEDDLPRMREQSPERQNSNRLAAELSTRLGTNPRLLRGSPLSPSQAGPSQADLNQGSPTKRVTLPNEDDNTNENPFHFPRLDANAFSTPRPSVFTDENVFQRSQSHGDLSAMMGTPGGGRRTETLEAEGEDEDAIEGRPFAWTKEHYKPYVDKLEKKLGQASRHSMAAMFESNNVKKAVNQAHKEMYDDLKRNADKVYNEIQANAQLHRDKVYLRDKKQEDKLMRELDNKYKEMKDELLNQERALTRTINENHATVNARFDDQDRSFTQRINTTRREIGDKVTVLTAQQGKAQVEIDNVLSKVTAMSAQHDQTQVNVDNVIAKVNDQNRLIRELLKANNLPDHEEVTSSEVRFAASQRPRDRRRPDEHRPDERRPDNRRPEGDGEETPGDNGGNGNVRGGNGGDYDPADADDSDGDDYRRRGNGPRGPRGPRGPNDRRNDHREDTPFTSMSNAYNNQNKLRREEVGVFDPEYEDPQDIGMVTVGKDLVFTDVWTFIDRLESFKDGENNQEMEASILRMFPTLLQGAAIYWWTNELSATKRQAMRSEGYKRVLDVLSQRFSMEPTRATRKFRE